MGLSVSLCERERGPTIRVGQAIILLFQGLVEEEKTATHGSRALKGKKKEKKKGAEKPEMKKGLKFRRHTWNLFGFFFCFCFCFFVKN